MLDQAFDAAQARGILKQAHARGHADSFFPSSAHQNGEHSAEPFHLAKRDVVSGMRGQSWIQDLLHFRVTGQSLGHGARVGAVPLHATWKRTQAAQDQP